MMEPKVTVICKNSYTLNMFKFTVITEGNNCTLLIEMKI